MSKQEVMFNLGVNVWWLVRGLENPLSELAAMMGSDKTRIHKIVELKSSPGVSFACNLATALGVQPEELAKAPSPVRIEYHNEHYSEKVAEFNERMSPTT